MDLNTLATRHTVGRAAVLAAGLLLAGGSARAEEPDPIAALAAPPPIPAAALAPPAPMAAPPAAAAPAPTAATPTASSAAPMAAPAPVTKPTDNVYPPSGVSQGGGVGFGRFLSADAGRPGSLRLNLRGSFFQLDKFPVKGTDRLLGGEISGGLTVYQGIEIFGAYQNSSNSNTKTTPSVVQAQGDGVVGAKAGGTVGPMKLAGLVQFDLRNGLGSDHITLNASALEVRGLATYATRAGSGNFQLDLNVGGIIGTNKDALDARLNGENAALLFGTGFSAYHRVVTGLLLRYEMTPVSPFLGVDFDIPLGVSNANLKAAKTDTFGAAAKRLTIGARIPTWHFGALDVALQGGLGTGVTGFAKTEPWLLTAAYSFAFDPGLYRPAPPPPPPAPVAPPKPETAPLRGTIVDSATGAPIWGVVVTPAGSLPVATGPDGQFVTRDLKPGAIELKFEREGYEASIADVTATLKPTPIAIKLVALPTPAPVAPPPEPVAPTIPTGYIAGMVQGPDGAVVADVKISGPTSQTLKTNSDGTFSAKLPSGKYDVLILPENFFSRAATITVTPDNASAVVVRTTPKNESPTVTLAGDAIQFTAPYALDEKRVEPTDAQINVLAEVADILIRNPEKLLVVDVHSDLPKGAKTDRIDWTEERAQAIRSALISQGAAADRVEAHGLGNTQPLVPATSKAANTNRRVELKLIPRPERKVVPIQLVPSKPEGTETTTPPAGDQQPGLLDLPPIN